jgi:hypothetical protein
VKEEVVAMGQEASRVAPWLSHDLLLHCTPMFRCFYGLLCRNTVMVTSSPCRRHAKLYP